MNNTYTSLVKQTFHFPQEGFDVNDNGYLEFNGLDLKAIIEKHASRKHGSGQQRDVFTRDRDSDSPKTPRRKKRPSSDANTPPSAQLGFDF